MKSNSISVSAARDAGACDEAIEWAGRRDTVSVDDVIAYRPAWAAWADAHGLCRLTADQVAEVVRLAVARRIHAGRIDRLPAPTEEPEGIVRLEIARRMQQELLPARVPTPTEEPDAAVRSVIAGRIPSERLERVPTQDEEPDRLVRETIASRLVVVRD